METRGYRQNYFALNDGYDSAVLPEDQLSNSPTPGPSSNLRTTIVITGKCLYTKAL
ncbi:uncharacterized protein V1513DRAFT_437887 [Lipomyces chichibuensis]|uniref:uncharacterized protein n=1 Tax=Lipomyces chichibuensis TaxID=1546026 RepID=UPI003343FBAA